MSDLKAGVVGAGVFAGFHARKYASLPDVTLAGVYDPDTARARELAADLGVSAFDSLPGLLDACHMVTVASPASTHAEVAEHAIAFGRHIYVEKPLARTLDAGAALVEHAGQRRLVLACGHQERVTFAAMGLLDTPEPPRRLESVRRGLPGPRSRDVLLRARPDDPRPGPGPAAGRRRHPCRSRRPASSTRCAPRSSSAAACTLGCRPPASRSARERTMHLDYPSGVVEVDFLAPSFANSAPFALDPLFAASPEGRDPLGASVGGFVAAVQGRARRPVVTGEEGLAALALALRVEQAAGL